MTKTDEQERPTYVVIIERDDGMRFAVHLADLRMPKDRLAKIFEMIDTAFEMKGRETFV